MIQKQFLSDDPRHFPRDCINTSLINANCYILLIRFLKAVDNLTFRWKKRSYILSRCSDYIVVISKVTFTLKYLQALTRAQLVIASA